MVEGGDEAPATSRVCSCHRGREREGVNREGSFLLGMRSLLHLTKYSPVPPQHHLPTHLLKFGGPGTSGLSSKQPAGFIPVPAGSTASSLPPLSAPLSLSAPLPTPHPKLSTTGRLSFLTSVWPRWGHITGLLSRAATRSDLATATYWKYG